MSSFRARITKVAFARFAGPAAATSSTPSPERSPPIPSIPGSLVDERRRKNREKRRAPEATIWMSPLGVGEGSRRRPDGIVLEGSTLL